MFVGILETYIWHRYSSQGVFAHFRDRFVGFLSKEGRRRRRRRRRRRNKLIDFGGETRVPGWACDPILANARETLCISPAHIDTLIPRETEVWWQNICRSNSRPRSCEFPSPRHAFRPRSRSLHRIKCRVPESTRDLPQRQLLLLTYITPPPPLFLSLSLSRTIYT